MEHKKGKLYYERQFIRGYDQRLTVMEAHKFVNRTARAMQLDGYTTQEIQAIADKARAFHRLPEIKR